MAESGIAALAVQVTPNTTDPAFQRPRSDFGLRIYASHSGKLLQTLPISSADWARAAKPGAAYFLDAFPGWVGFQPDDKAVLRIDSVSGQPMAQALKLAALAADPQDKAAASCPVLVTR